MDLYLIYFINLPPQTLLYLSNNYQLLLQNSDKIIHSYCILRDGSNKQYKLLISCRSNFLVTKLFLFFSSFIIYI